MLQTPNLDDRSFQDLVDEAKRLIPRYCPDWTDHNLSDPGVALIELFAWMTDLTLYRLNQVPDRLYVRFLELLGISLYPAAAARTDIVFWLAGPQPEAVRVPIGTQVGTVRTERDESVVFMTDEERIIVAPTLSACLNETGGQHEDNLSNLSLDGYEVICFPSVRPGDAVYFGFAESLAGNVIRMRFDATVKGEGVNPNWPPWLWEAVGEDEWQPCHVLRDDTLALNRSGAITMIVPRVHEAITVGPTRAHWIRCRLVPPELNQPAFKASPKVQSLAVTGLGGVAGAHHAQPAPAEVLGRSDGTPGQRFAVRRTPVLPRIEGEGVRVRTATDSLQWTEVADFRDSGRRDPHFGWDSTSGEVVFGPAVTYPDGGVRRYGAVPPVDAVISTTGYRYGGGARGNVGARTITWLKSSLPFIGRVENLDPATGGVDAETVANAKLRGPLSLRTGSRAVTAADYERLTLEASPAVARAHCLAPPREGGPVRVLIIPRLETSSERLALNDLALAPELVTEVADYLDERRMLTTTVQIHTPLYQGVTVKAILVGAPGGDPALLRSRALGALYGYVNPLTGGSDGAGWPFGRPLGVGDVYALLSGLPSVVAVDEVVLELRDLRTASTQGQRQRIELAPDTLFLSLEHEVELR